MTLVNSVSVVAPSTAESNRPYVLLVDDDGPCLQCMRTILELVGYGCRTARSGEEALIVCASDRPQIVVTDESMPGMEGHVLAHRLKQRFPAVPIIVMTGEDLDDPAHREHTADFDERLLKPVDPADLLDLLGTYYPPSHSPEPKRHP